MGLPKYQYILCWILMCVLPVHLKAATLPQINPQTKSEITNGHGYTPTVLILDTSLASNKTKSSETALSQTIAESNNKTTNRNDNNFSASNSQATSPEHYKEKNSRKISNIHPIIGRNNNRIGLKSSFHAVKQNKTKDSYSSFLFNRIYFPHRPSAQQNIHHKDNNHNKAPSLQPKLRLARNVPQENNKTDEGNNKFNSTNSTTNETTKLADNILKVQSNYLILDYYRHNKTSKVVRNIHKNQDNISSSDVPNFTENTTKIANLLQKYDNIEHEEDSDASETTTTVDALLNDQNTSINDSHTNTITHVIFESTRSEMSTEFSNIIPQGPFIREEPGSNNPETTSSSPKPENQTALSMDGTNSFDNYDNAINTTTQSHTNHDHFGEEQAHIHDPANITIPETTTNLDAPSHNSDASIHPEHATDKGTGASNKNGATDFLNDILVQISLHSEGDSMVVSWVVDTNHTQISGFLVSYRMNDREDFDSSSLGSSVRSFTLHSLHEDKDYVICVHAMVNDTVVKSSCAEWSKSSMKMVIGILAGVIFLLPCSVVIVWILYTDYKVKQKASFHKLTDEANECEDNNISFTKAKHSHSHEKNDNSRLTVDDKVIVVSGRRPSHNHHQEAGHENPCGGAAVDCMDDEVGDGL